MDATTFRSIAAILEGGPESIPETSRVRKVSPSDEKIKLPHHGGYEHFQRVGEAAAPVAAAAPPLVFRWTMRTEVAE